MKKFSGTFLLIVLSVLTVRAQTGQSKLAELPALLDARITKAMPGWNHRSIEPMQGSKDTIVEQWESGSISVKVAVTEYESQSQAIKALEDFKRQLRIQEDAAAAKGREFHLVKEALPFLGEGGFGWNIKGSDAAVFTRKNFLVSVSIARPEHHYDLSLSKMVGQYVIDVLNTQ